MLVYKVYSTVKLLLKTLKLLIRNQPSLGKKVYDLVRNEKYLPAPTLSDFLVEEYYNKSGRNTKYRTNAYKSFPKRSPE